MRKLIALSAVLLASAVLAQDTPPSRPDFSRETLQKLFINADQEKPDVTSNIQFGVGYVDFKALGQRWRFAYLPILMPFPGSVPTTTHVWPDPFLLTGTEIAMTPRTFRRSRAVNAEMKRIERTERAKVKAKTE